MIEWNVIGLLIWPFYRLVFPKRTTRNRRLRIIFSIHLTAFLATIALALIAERRDFIDAYKYGIFIFAVAPPFVLASLSVVFGTRGPEEISR